MMNFSHKHIAEMAHNLKHGSNVSRYGIPPPATSLQYADIIGTNLFQGHVDLAWPAPPGTAPSTSQGVHYLVSYNGAYQPATGHSVLVQMIGSRAIVLGQLINVTDRVTI